MKITKIQASKEFKIGLPNYSNFTVGMGIDAEVGENEKVDWDALWDIINQQLTIQSGNTDPSWITNGEYKNFFKTTIKIPKEGGED